LAAANKSSLAHFFLSNQIQIKTPDFKLGNLYSPGMATYAPS